MDLQAMARAHRIGQKTEVRVLRLITASPIEEKILATANEKLDQEAKIIEAGKFNQTSDASERRETLQKLLAQSADDAGEEAGIPTDEEINEMIARPNPKLNLTREEEVEKLNAMDTERLEKSSSNKKGGGGGSGRSSALLTDADLPAWLGEAELLQAQKKEADGMDVVDGPRERKATSGGESSKAQTELSERDFTRWAQTGLDLEEWKAQEEVRSGRSRRRRRRATSHAVGGRVWEVERRSRRRRPGSEREREGRDRVMRCIRIRGAF